METSEPGYGVKVRSGWGNSHISFGSIHPSNSFEGLKIVAFASVIAACALFAAGCRHHPQAQNPPAKTPAPSEAPQTQPPPPVGVPGKPTVAGGWTEEGVASWYGYPFQGRRTSNGEVYEMHQMTAAHRTLPFNSVVRVTNLTNGKVTEVRINDRGPFVANRIIDLSLSAAEAIEMVGPGTAHVRLEVISGPNPKIGYFGVQVGAFLVQDNAAKLKSQLEPRYPPVSVVPFQTEKGTYYRVRVGRLPSESAARNLAEQLHEGESFTTFVVRLDE